MLKHNITMALRSLNKYKTQNIISIIGLAIGFTCFAFSALWIRYEMSYDSFHRNADRIYRVHIAPFKWDAGAANASEITNCPYPLAEFLKTNFPEIEEAGAMRSYPRSVGSYEFSILMLDQSISNIFDLNLPEDFFILGRQDRPVAVTPEFYHDEAKEIIKEQMRWDVSMTVPGWQPNTNIPFNLIAPINVNIQPQQLNRWYSVYQDGTVTANLLIRAYEIYILAHNNVDIQALEKKLDKFEVPELVTPMSAVLTPLTQLRYKDPTGATQLDAHIKFTHIRIFALAGLMVILCSLFNHLTLYVTCIRMRLREIALRKVHGATNWQIAVTLYADFLLVIFLSLILGFMLMVWLMPTFKDFATIASDKTIIYYELLVYAALLVGCGFIVGGVPILYYQRQALLDSIKGGGSPGSKNTFRKGSLLVQLIISLGMMFCALVFIKQIRFLHTTDLGIKRDNIVTVWTNFFALRTVYAEQIQQIPGVVDAIPISRGTLRPNHSGSFPHSFTDSLGNTATYNLFILIADNRFFDFFGVEIIEGRSFNNDYTYEFLLNETAMKEVGKFEGQSTDFFGVMRDFYLFPTERAKATKIHYPTGNRDGWLGAIAYNYEEGWRKQTEDAVRQWIYDELSSTGQLDRIPANRVSEFDITFTYMEDVFEENFKSERALLTLLSIMTLACILIAIFGVYSLTSLTCQQRRKEIAIRKVYGAEVVDILNIFFAEYLILLALAAIVAFPAGYLIMKRWLENYVKQTTMDAWIYVAIFLAVFAVIVVSIFWMVWKAASRNPAEVVKSE